MALVAIVRERPVYFGVFALGLSGLMFVAVVVSGVGGAEGGRRKAPPLRSGVRYIDRQAISNRKF